jgi:hypothetical protein
MQAPPKRQYPNRLESSYEFKSRVYFICQSDLRIGNMEEMKCCWNKLIPSKSFKIELLAVLSFD